MFEPSMVFLILLQAVQGRYVFCTSGGNVQISCTTLRLTQWQRRVGCNGATLGSSIYAVMSRALQVVAPPLRQRYVPRGDIKPTALDS